MHFQVQLAYISAAWNAMESRNDKFGFVSLNEQKYINIQKKCLDNFYFIKDIYLSFMLVYIKAHYIAVI